MPCFAFRLPAFAQRALAVRRDSRGAAMMEFGFVAAPLIALLIAIFQTSLVFFSQQGLQTTAEDTARLIFTGQAQQQGMTAAQFKTAACTKLPPFLACSKLMVDVRKASTFAAIDTTVPTITYDANGNPTNSLAYNLGGAGEIVILRLMYLWPVGTGPLGLNIANSGTANRLLIATTVSKTEPY